MRGMPALEGQERERESPESSPRDGIRSGATPENTVSHDAKGASVALIGSTDDKRAVKMWCFG